MNIAADHIEFRRFILQCERIIAQIDDYADRLEALVEPFNRLLLERRLVEDAVMRLFKDEDYLRSQSSCLHKNELKLYRDPHDEFSVRLFLWQAGVMSEIHDHGSWGLVGCALNQLKILHYRRLDDGSKPGFAELEPSKQVFLEPGQCEKVFPFNHGIHQVGADVIKPAISISLYLKPLRKGYIYAFNRLLNKCWKEYPTIVEKKYLATLLFEHFESSSRYNALWAASDDRTPLVRLEAMKLLLKVAPERRQDIIEKGLHDPAQEVRKGLKEYLEGIGD